MQICSLSSGGMHNDLDWKSRMLDSGSRSACWKPLNLLCFYVYPKREYYDSYWCYEIKFPGSPTKLCKVITINW